MSAFSALQWRTGEAGERVGEARDARWFAGFRVLRASGAPLALRTGDDEESGLILLSGTHDLEAASGSWASRGVRPSPFEGRPVALFVPARTPLRISGGEGELLLVSARQPRIEVVEQPAEKPAKKPLLPLAGSNKAFDPATGTWQPIESFPDSAEFIRPSRIEVREIGGVRTERVFPPEYKTRGLCAFEAVLPEGSTLDVPGSDAHGAFPEEWALFLRSEGEVAVGDQVAEAEAAFCGSGTVSVTARTGRCYAVVAYTGPKPGPLA